MKKLLFLICTLFSINAFAQIIAAPPANGDDTTKYTIWGYSPYGIKMQRMFTYKVMRPPRDTSFTKGGLAIIGSTFYYGDETQWWPVRPSVTYFSSGHLTPLFTTSVYDPSAEPALSFSLSNTTAYTVFGRASGTGTPSYVSLDTTFISSFSAKVRSLFSAGTGLTYNEATGQFVNTASGGTVTDVSIVTANGFQGSVANASTSPDITLETSVTSNQIIYASSNDIVGSANLTYDGSLVTGLSAGLGVTQDDTKGLLLTNTTAAAAGAQQISPSLHWRGQGWKTNATAASQSVDFRSYVLPVQGAANPSGNWKLQQSINGGAYSDVIAFGSLGEIFTGAGSAGTTNQAILSGGPGAAWTWGTVDLSASNELQTIAVTGTTTGITTLSNSGGSMTIAGAGINTVGVAGSTITITGTEVDGSTSNELQTLSGSGTSSPTVTLSNGGGAFSITGAGIAVASRSGLDITITATEVDGSTTNELQSLSHTSDGDSHKVELSTAAGSLELIEGTGITLTTGGSGANQTVTITSTALEYEIINGLHLSSPDSIKLGGYLIENTEINGNEGAYDMAFAAIDSFSVAAININLAAGAGGAVSLGGKIYYTTDVSPTSIGSNQNNYSPTDFATASVLRLTSDASRNITGLAGGVDGRTLKIFNVGSNDIVLKDEDANSTAANRFEFLGDKTIKPGDGIDLWYDETTDRWRALNITQQIEASNVLGKARITLTNSEGTYFELEAGTGVSISQSGSVNATKVTIEADLSAVVSDVTASGLLTSSGGTTPDISSSIAQARLVGRGGSSGTGIFEAITVGGILSFSGTTLNATEVDGSTSNELQTLSGSGTSTPTITLSDGGGAFSITGAGIAVASRSGTDITITATEVDGSTSNELQTITNSSDATSHTQTLSNGGGTTQFIEGQNITLTTGGSGSAGTVTIAVDKVLASGTYTPTLTGAENIGSSTAYECQYLRVGNVVTVSGKVDITWSTDGTFTRLGVSLPIASGFTSDEQAGGTANSQGDVQNGHLAIRADAGNDRAEIHGYSASSGEGYTYYFTFTYLIL